jgi:small subunit ribosomal protein S3
MSRREWYREGRVPLHTLRAKIDYGQAEANTTFGKIGVKVWVYSGDEIPTEEKETAMARARALAGMRLPTSASTGALITDPKDLADVEEEPVAPSAEAEAGSAEAEPSEEEKAAAEAPADESAETKPKKPARKRKTATSRAKTASKVKVEVEAAKPDTGEGGEA